MSRIEKPEECEACKFETDKLEFYEHGSGYPPKAGNWLCTVCAQTKSGNAHRVPHHYENSETLHMIAYCTNMILKKLDDLKK